MDPQRQCCPNVACAARGQVGQGNIRVHSWHEHRYRCVTCRRTFAATTGTPFYRRHSAAATLTVVVTLLAHGCPLQAIVAAFGLDERTVARWQAAAGAHCQQVHEHVVQQGQLDLGHVQADELWVKHVGGNVWMALALMVPSRLWLGGVVSPRRDGALIAALVRLVRVATTGVGTGLLVCVDGLARYVTAFRRAFRVPRRTGRVGRPRLVLPDGFLLGQVVKQYAQRHVAGVVHRVRNGTATAVTATLVATHGGTVLNTAYIERLNATFRQHLAPLTRRGRALARTHTVLTAGMFLVGCAYNLCWYHDSLRQAAPTASTASTASTAKWVERTPAMAAGLTDHRWTMEELLRCHVPLPRWVAPRRRGRPPKERPTRTPLPKGSATHGQIGRAT